MKPNASKEAKAAFFWTTIAVIALAVYPALSIAAAPADRAQVPCPTRHPRPRPRKPHRPG